MSAGKAEFISMFFGLHIHQWPPETDEFGSISTVASWAENSGFSLLSASDHIHPFGQSATRRNSVLDPWILLASAAHATKNLQLATLVTNTTLRDPWHLAKASASLDLLSQGRFVLGLGSGGSKQESSSFGSLVLRADQRTSRLRESIDVIRLLWSGNDASYDGSHFQITKAVSMPSPRSRIPILIGGKSAMTLAVVAEKANLANVTFASPSQVGLFAERIQQQCIKIGRDPTQVGLTLLQRVIIRPEKSDLESSENSSLDGLIGTPDSVVAEIKEYAHAGISTMFVFFPQNDSLSMQLFAEEVMPVFLTTQSHSW